MKSKSVVFFFAVLCLFLSHCTNVGSYSPNRFEKVGIVDYEIEISILERRIKELEMEFFSFVTNNKEEHDRFRLNISTLQFYLDDLMLTKK